MTKSIISSVIWTKFAGILLASIFFSASTHAEDQHYVPEHELYDGSSSALYIKEAQGYTDAPILSSTLNIDVSGVVSKIELTQTFQNKSTNWVEGLYVFPLPDQAAVNSLIVKIGDREIIGKIREKKQAEQQYEIAKQAGQVASLVKQQRPNLFSTRFANIPPGETISISLGYIQTVNYENSRYSLRVPMTLTPRYSNDLVADTADITPPQIKRGQNTANNEINHQVVINAVLFGHYSEAQISSPSHALSINWFDNNTTITPLEQAFLDRDFILEWHELVETEPVVSLWKESVNGDDYLLASVTPPLNESDIPIQHRELILVIDTSGSMAGTSIEAAKAALLDALAGLTAGDKFNIIEFNSTHRSLFTSPAVANHVNLQRAKAFTRGLVADGGTEMMGALRTALAYKESNVLRQVVFITDGSVGYEDSVIEAVKNQLGSARLFTVGIGTAPNQWFMRKVALAGRGSYQLIHDLNNVQREMSSLLRKLASPALTDINIAFEGGTAEAVPNPIPDLYAREPIVIAAKLNGAPHTLKLSGKWAQTEWQTMASISDAPVSQTGLSTVWAKKKIESLLDKQRNHSDNEYYRSIILRLALDHKLLSPYTAFLAVEETPVRPIESDLMSKKVPNLLPAGSQMQPVAFPQGSAGMDTLLLLSFLSSLVAIFTAFWRAITRSVVLP